MGTDITKSTESFGGLTLEKSAELSAIAIAASARAEVESRHVMAMKNPRDEEGARLRILAACEKPMFARKARFNKPVGGGQSVVGPSIRFAEEMARSWKNILCQGTVLYDDDYKRVVKIIVGDLEANVAYSREIMIEKTVERSSAQDRQVVSQRKNSKGYDVYIVKATEDELLIKQEALSSKVIRNNILRLIPEHIVEESMERVAKTIRDKVAQDPDAEKHQLLEAFARRGVMPLDLTDYLGAPPAQWTPDQFVKLNETLAYLEESGLPWRTFLEGTPMEEAEEIKTKSQPETKGQEIKKADEEKPAGHQVPHPEPAKATSQGKASEPAKEPDAPPKPPAGTLTPEQDIAELVRLCTEQEVHLIATPEGKKAYRQVWGNFKLPDKSFGTDGGAQYLASNQVAFYLRQLKQASSAAQEGKKEKK